MNPQRRIGQILQDQRKAGRRRLRAAEFPQRKAPSGAGKLKNGTEATGGPSHSCSGPTHGAVAAVIRSTCFQVPGSSFHANAGPCLPPEHPWSSGQNDQPEEPNFADVANPSLAVIERPSCISHLLLRSEDELILSGPHSLWPVCIAGNYYLANRHIQLGLQRAHLRRRFVFGQLHSAHGFVDPGVWVGTGCIHILGGS